MTRKVPTGHDRRLRWGDGWIEPRTNAAGEPRYLARWRELDPATGRRVLRAKMFSSEGAAESHLRDVADRQAHPGYVPPQRLTVAEMLDAFLVRGAASWAPGTRGVYRQRTTTLIVPELGKVLATDLTAPRVQHWIDALVRRGYAAETIVGTRRILSAACKEAMMLGILRTNPVTGTRPPTVRPPTGTIWNAEEVRRVLAAVADDPLLNAAFRVALSTGVRPGELLALRWPDIDLDRGVMMIRRTVTMDEDHHEIVGETTKGRRARALALSPSTVTALREWRRAQVEMRLASRFWADAEAVVTNDRGERVYRQAWGAVHAGVVERAGVRSITPHDLRHTFATQALENGVPLKVVADMLGHRSVMTTADRYQHVDLAMQARSTEAMERLLFELPSGQPVPDVGDVGS